MEMKLVFSKAACWITAPGGNESWQIFRKEFDVSSSFVRVMLLATSSSYHEVYLNGTLVNRGPARSFGFDKYYDAVDVTRWVRIGSNAIAVLSPQFKQKDAPFMLNPPDGGVLIELIVTGSKEADRRVASDHTWKAHSHDAFKKGTAWYAIPLGPEEQYDSREEASGWDSPGFNDSGWANACVIGPVGTPPWTAMHLNNMAKQSSDIIYAKRFMTAELAATPRGYNFRLGPANEGVMIFMSDVHVKQPCRIKLRFTAHIPIVHIDGKPVNVADTIELDFGIHHVAFCQLCYGAVEPELLVETEADLDFDSGLFPDIPWALFTVPAKTLAYPWHEKPSDILSGMPEVNLLLSAVSTRSIPPALRCKFIQAVVLETSSYHKVVTQKFSLPAGGFADISIQAPQPRERLGVPFTAPLSTRQCLLHDGGDDCTVIPQEGKDVHFILDFGREHIGHVELNVDAPDGTIVDVQCFELIDGGGIAWMPVHNGFRYICKEGQQTFLSHYRRGFRYVSVTLRSFERPVTLYAIRMIHTAYPIEEIGSFECSDELLNKVYRMSLDTAALCMLDAYVDCPGHEQNFWVGDARITALINLINFGAVDLNQSFIRIVGQSLREEWVKTYWPEDQRYLERRYLPIAAFPNYPEGCLPMWTFQWMLQIWEHYFHGGSKEDLAENFEYIKGTIENCRRLTNERYLFDMPGAWNLIEWGNNDLSPYGEVTANNVLLVLCLERAADMADALGSHELSREYKAESARRRDAINRYCWDDRRQAYIDTVRDEWAYDRYLSFAEQKEMLPLSFDDYMSLGRVSVQSNTLALLSGCVPPDRINPVKKIITSVETGKYVSGAPSCRSAGNPPENEAPNGIVAVGSPFFLFFSLGALYQIDNADCALKVMRRDWADMIAHGTNTCWETFAGDEKHWTRSIAHAWAAAPAVYLPMEVLGIKPIEPGYKKFTIEPKLGNLVWARGTVWTPYGPISVLCSRTNGGVLNIQWQAPDECAYIR